MVFRGPFQAIWNQNWVICLKKTPWTLKNKEWTFFAQKILIFIQCIQTYLNPEAWNFGQSLSYDNQGHLPSLGGSPTNPRKVTNQPKDGHPKKRRKCTTDMEFGTCTLLTKLTPCDNCHGWSPSILMMVTHQPKNGHPLTSGSDLEIVQSVSGNFNVLLKNFCEKREYIGSKTRNYAKKCFW